MSYEKQNFVKGQVLKAEHLNHIEDGIAKAAIAYEEEVYFLPESELTFADMGEGMFGAMVPMELPAPMKIGAEYTVTFDGTVYKCVNIGTDSSVILGNGAAMGGEDSGEPFIAMYDGNGKYWFVMPLIEATKAIFSVRGFTVKKMGEEYLPVKGVELDLVALGLPTVTSETFVSVNEDYSNYFAAKFKDIMDKGVIKLRVNVTATINSAESFPCDGEVITCATVTKFHYGSEQTDFDNGTSCRYTLFAPLGDKALYAYIDISGIKAALKPLLTV